MTIRRIIHRMTAFKVTDSWLRSKYVHFNEMFWNGALPDIPLDVVHDDSSFWKNCYAAAEYTPNQQNKTVEDLRIRFTDCHWWLTEKHYEELLLHEMIHIDDYMTHQDYYSVPWYLRDEDNEHGEYFMTKAAEISEHGWMITNKITPEMLKLEKEFMS